MSTLRTVDQHRQVVASLVIPVLAALPVEHLPVTEAVGRTLAIDYLAGMDLPSFNNSQMDGYAVRSAETGAQLRVTEDIPAGTAPPSLPLGCAAPIMTGAMIPAGADAVVPVEYAEPEEFLTSGELVWLPKTAVGKSIRRQGSDVQGGSVVLTAGTVLRPAQLGLLASLGNHKVVVWRRLRVALLSTGDELIIPGDGVELPAGKIYDSNSTLLTAALQEVGAEPVLVIINSDSVEEFKAALAAVKADIILTTGGVSQGKYEVVKQALAQEPIAQDLGFVKVAMQPGGPQGLGIFLGTPILSFPGNPVSAAVSFEVFLRPLLTEKRQTVWLPLLEEASSPQDKHQIRRGKLFPNEGVRLQGGPGSHLMAALAGSDALVHFPVGVDFVAAGQNVEVWIL